MQTAGGSRVGFIEYADGTYSVEPGTCGTLTRTGTSGSYVYTYTNSQDVKYVFRNDGKLTALDNGRGQTLNMTYDGSGRLERVAEPTNQRYLTFAYPSGKLDTVTDSAGRSIAYGYTGGNLTSFTDARGKVWTYQYTNPSFPNFVTARLDPLGQTLVSYEYDTQGRAFRESDGAGQVIVELAFNTDGTTTVTRGQGGVGGQETHEYDARHTLTDQSNTAGGSTTSYDDNFRPDQVTDANGNPTDLVWSDDGSSLTGVTDALGNPTGFAYDDRHHLTLVTNADGSQTYFVYNSPGATNPLTSEVIYNSAWDQDLLLMQIDNYAPLNPGADANLVTRYFYTDAADAPQPPNLVERVEATGGVTCYAYNAFGQQTEVISDCGGAHSVTTLYAYDSAGRLTDTTQADGTTAESTTHTIYIDGDDRADEVISHYDASKAAYQDGIYNLSTRTFLDALGRTVATVSNYHPGTIPGGAAVAFDFDGDTLTDVTLQMSIEAPEYNQVSLTRYDAAGRVYETIANFWPGQAAYYLNKYNTSARTYYDGAGRVVATVSNYKAGDLPGSGSPQAIDFDGDSQTDATLEISPDAPEFNQISRTVYDSAGRVSKTISTAWPGQPDYHLGTYNIVSATEYDAAGNVLKSITNYDQSVSGGYSVPLDLVPDTGGVKETTIHVDPAAPDRNQITCTEVDALNRPVLIRSACVPGQADYLESGDNLYNLVSYTVYDAMGRQVASVRNYDDPEQDGVLVLSSERNFITRTYYDSLGRAEYTVENYTGHIGDPQPGVAAQAGGRIVPGAGLMSGPGMQAAVAFNPLSQAESGVVSSFVGGWSAPVPDAPPAYDPAYPDRNLVTRTLYDDQGRQFVTIRNLWNPDGGALTQGEIQAGYPDRNLVSYTHYNASGQVDWTVENFVGDLSTLGDTPPAFSASTPDQNLLTRYTYDTAGRRYETTIDRGGQTRVSHTDFDTMGRTWKTIANYVDGTPGPTPDQDVTTVYAYEALGRITQVTDPADNVRRSVSEQLDAVLGRTSLSITDPSGLALTSTSVSNAAGQTSRSIDASGRVAETTFDAQGRAVETTTDPDNLALTSSSAYDLLGRAITSTDAEGIVSRYQYDNLGRLRVVFENYVSGQSDSSWPACQYDIDAVNVCTRYAYDEAGNLTSTVLGSGSGTTYTYDARGQMKLETVDPGGENIATAYSYDAAGNQVTLTRDPNGAPQLTTTFHDRLGRTTGIDYVGTASDVVYSYDAWGNRHTMLDAGGTWQYAYDAMSHLTSVTNPQSVEVAYEYDPTGNRTDLDLPGMSVDYTFDNAGRLDTVSNPFGTGVVDYDYDDADMTGATLPNGMSTTNSYDTAGRLEQILNAAGLDNLSSFVYTLDDRGNRTDAAETLTTPSGMLMSASMPTETPTPTPSETPAPTPTPDLTVTPTEMPTVTPTESPTVTSTPTETLTPTETPTVSLTETPAETPTEAPTLAPSETPTPEVTPTATEPPMPTLTPMETPASLLMLLAAEGEHNWHYDYDNLSRVTYACSDWTGTACAPTGHEFHYAYDGSGNLLRFDKWNASTNVVETVRYVINGANQIACIDADNSHTCNGSETPWIYDAYGNLTNDGLTQYTYDKANRLSSITNASGTTTYTYNGDNDRISQTVNSTLTTYVLDTATPLTMVLSETTGGVTTCYWHGLDTLAQSDGTTTQYFAYDGLGSVRQLVDATGSVGLAQTFDPYGNGYAKAGSAASSLGFTGEQTDSNGFVFLRARYYQPGMGRFTQMDPSRQEKNAYQYGLSNPVLHTDPSGLVVGPLKCAPWDLWCQFVTSNQSGSSSQPGNVHVKLNLRLPASLLALDGCSGGWQGDLKDFFEGFGEQLLLDMVGVPVSTVIELTANTPGIGSQARDFLISRTLDQAHYDMKYWTGSDAYRTGRQAGRILSTGIGAALTAIGIVDTVAALTIAVPTAAAGAVCEFASVGGCTPAAAALWAVDVAVVAQGVAVAAYGGMILYAASSPVGRSGSSGGSNQMFGENGTQGRRNSIYQQGPTHLDAENFAPGKREASLHVQDLRFPDAKWQWNPDLIYQGNKGWFEGMPKTMSEWLVKDRKFQKAIDTGLAFLGESR